MIFTATPCHVIQSSGNNGVLMFLSSIESFQIHSESDGLDRSRDSGILDSTIMYHDHTSTHHHHGP